MHDMLRRKVNAHEVLSCDAYMLFYTRTNPRQDPPQIPLSSRNFLHAATGSPEAGVHELSDRLTGVTIYHQAEASTGHHIAARRVLEVSGAGQQSPPGSALRPSRSHATPDQDVDDGVQFLREQSFDEVARVTSLCDDVCGIEHNTQHLVL